MSMSRQVAIVTGAASGIGRRFALDLRARRPDMRLVLADVNGDALASSFQAGEDVVLEAFDVRSLEEWQRVVGETVERYGAIDYLMNIAGIDRTAMFIDQPLENIDSIVDINLKGSLYGMKLVAERMAGRARGASSTSRRSPGSPQPQDRDLLRDQVRAARPVARHRR